MATVIGFGATFCTDPPQRSEHKTIDRSFTLPIAAGIIVDAIAVPTLIVIGILGALGAISLSPAASFAMIGVGIACALPHVAIAAYSRTSGSGLTGLHAGMFRSLAQAKEDDAGVHYKKF